MATLGAEAMVWDLALLVLPPCAAAVTLAAWRFGLRLPGVKATGIGFAVFSVFGISYSAAKLRRSWWVNHLTTSEVVGVRLGSTLVSTPEGIDRLVGALRSNDWFLPNHGDWKKEVPFTLALADGREVHARVARHARLPGAVVHFVSPSGDWEFDEGWIYVASLPEVSESLGAELPWESRYQR